MNGSFKIARLFGIDVRLDSTFLILPFAFTLIAGPWGLAWVVGVFTIVLLHELGHSLVAKAFGVRVVDITFWPLGGMARMADIPEKPRVEGLIAIAGPAVNFALAALCAPLAHFADDALVRGLAEIGLIVNLGMGIFNLLPAFPMDGGRVLRAWLARTRDYVTATEQAVRTGRWVTLFLLLAALPLAFLPGFGLMVCILPLIVVFIWYAGGRELLAVRLRHGRSPFGFARGAPGGFARGAPGGFARGAPGGFARGAAGPFAGGTDFGRGGAAERTSRPVGDPAPPGHHGGFTEEEIRELERFRGRLRRPARGDESP